MINGRGSAQYQDLRCAIGCCIRGCSLRPHFLRPLTISRRSDSHGFRPRHDGKQQRHGQRQRYHWCGPRLSRTLDVRHLTLLNLTAQFRAVSRMQYPATLLLPDIHKRMTNIKSEPFLLLPASHVFQLISFHCISFHFISSLQRQ